MAEEVKAPFNEGDTVRIKGNDHLGLHRVDSCEWYTDTKRGAPHYWLCECTEIRDPIDWSKYPAGVTGIVTSSGWRGSADHLVLDHAQASTAEQIVDLIRAQNWKNGGVHSIDRDEAISLLEQYAAVAAAEASIKATTEAHDRTMAAFDAAMSKPLVTAACSAPIEGTNNLCTRDVGHPGEHRCLFVDVDTRRRTGSAATPHPDTAVSP